MPMTVALYKKLEEVEPQLRGVLFAILEEIEQQREETVTKVEFNELTEIVRDLAETQKQTERRINELTEVQRQTVSRLDRVETAVGQLTEAIRELVKEHKELVTAHRELVKEHSITRTIVNGLSTTTGFVLEDKAYDFLPALLKRDFGLEVQGELTRNFAKDKTGEQIEVNILGEAIRNGDRFVIIGKCKAQLSKNTDELDGSITVSLDDSITASYEYMLADEAYKFLPALLEQDFGLEVHGELVRKFVKDNKGESVQINIIGEAIRNGSHFIVVGESRLHLSKEIVDEFLHKKLKRLEGVYPSELFPILITHMISQPDVAEFALQQGIKRVYYSYEFA